MNRASRFLMLVKDEHIVTQFLLMNDQLKPIIPHLYCAHEPGIFQALALPVNILAPNRKLNVEDRAILIE